MHKFACKKIETLEIKSNSFIQKKSCIAWTRNGFIQLWEYTAQSPLQSFFAAFANKCTSSAWMLPHIALGVVSWNTYFLYKLLQAAPWQLNTPNTLVYVFIFQIFSKLHKWHCQNQCTVKVAKYIKIIVWVTYSWVLSFHFRIQTIQPLPIPSRVNK